MGAALLQLASRRFGLLGAPAPEPSGGGPEGLQTWGQHLSAQFLAAQEVAAAPGMGSSEAMQKVGGRAGGR